MKTSQMILILLITLCSGCALPGLFQPSSPRTISSIATGETMEVEFSSHGCFHRSHYKLAFTKQDGRITVTGVDLIPSVHSRFLKHSAKVGKELEPKILSRNEIVRLDRLLDYYRTPLDGMSFSTTMEMIKITHRTKSGIVRSESFADGSGGVHDQWGVLTIPDLVDEMRPRIRR